MKPPLLFVFFFAFLLIVPGSGFADQRVTVHVLPIQGSINPAQEDLLREAIDQSVRERSNLLVVRLDTPGGLGETTRNMVKLVLNAPVPVAVWVGPDGSRAASAGVFLVAASAVAGMSPYSNMGSARPVGMGGGDIPEAMVDKVLSDFVGLIRATALSRGRNVDWYVRAVTENANLTGVEALTERVIDFVAPDVDDFIAQIGARGLEWNNVTRHFTLDDVALVNIEPGLWHAILSWLLDPQIAYLLLMGGLAGLFFELLSPGAIFPGVLGGLCLLLGLYAMAILPTNVAGLLLILFGMMLFALELMITSFGLLSIAAVVAIFFGSVILFRFEYGMGAIPIWSILITTLGLSAFALFCVYLATKAHKHKPLQDSDTFIGQKAVVRQWRSTTGFVFFQGESWSAVSNRPLELNPDDAVYVTSVQGLTLTIDTTMPT